MATVGELIKIRIVLEKSVSSLQKAVLDAKVGVGRPSLSDVITIGTALRAVLEHLIELGEETQ